jgi:uncharacterized protein (DUF2062 family)
MSRHLIRQLSSRIRGLQDRWYVRAFGRRFFDPALWSAQRRGITGAFGVGLAICFIPLPVHIPLAIALAIVARLNVPVILATALLVNPLTVVPTYYFAYRVGAMLAGQTAQSFQFELSWTWLQYGLGPLWQPFLLGCLVCSATFGLLGWIGLELFWRWRVLRQYRGRPAAKTAKSGLSDQNPIL